MKTFCCFIQRAVLVLAFGCAFPLLALTPGSAPPPRDDGPRPFERPQRDGPPGFAADLIQLCRVLNKTPADQLEAALAPRLDIDSALKFLALENVLINTDGYWARASDFSLYQDEKGLFHIIPYDVNESFRAPQGPGIDRQRTQNVELDPLVAIGEARKPLLSKLLAVPSLRSRYLGYVSEIAEKWLDWDKLGPLARQYQALIAADVKADTRKLGSYDAFAKSLAKDFEEESPRGPRPRMSSEELRRTAPRVPAEPSGNQEICRPNGCAMTGRWKIERWHHQNVLKKTKL